MVPATVPDTFPAFSGPRNFTKNSRSLPSAPSLRPEDAVVRRGRASAGRKGPYALVTNLSRRQSSTRQPGASTASTSIRRMRIGQSPTSGCGMSCAAWSKAGFVPLSTRVPLHQCRGGSCTRRGAGQHRQRSLTPDPISAAQAMRGEPRLRSRTFDEGTSLRARTEARHWSDWTRDPDFGSSGETGTPSCQPSPSPPSASCGSMSPDRGALLLSRGCRHVGRIIQTVQLHSSQWHYNTY